jgi:hypothetical protein
MLSLAPKRTNVGEQDGVVNSADQNFLKQDMTVPKSAKCKIIPEIPI